MKNSSPLSNRRLNIAFIGSAGVPNRYGGFESFLEHCAPELVREGHTVLVTCDAKMYQDQTPYFKGVLRKFIPIPANGGYSIVHDLVAFINVFSASSHIIVLGVSGGIWFPVFRAACAITGRKLFVNIDGVEWRRTKFGVGKRALLRAFDYLAQKFSHHIIYDNEALFDFLVPNAKLKASCIAYPGDHVERLPTIPNDAGTALTICRIEPENNLEVLIEGFLDSKLSKYTIVGNWDHSEYSRNLRRRYTNEKRLLLVDPVYDSRILAQLRESCQFYLHGHSVGGTNPSLVEMLFYDCAILCYDVKFNRNTAKDCAKYFRTPQSLSELLNGEISVDLQKRSLIRELYTAKLISYRYLAIAQNF